MSKKNLENQGDGGGRTMQCPVCGEGNAPDAAVCIGCSFTFEADNQGKASPNIEESPIGDSETGSILCDECGAELPVGTDVCFICGAEMNVPETETTTIESQPEPGQSDEDWDPGVVGGDIVPSTEETPELEIPEEEMSQESDISDSELPLPEKIPLGENQFHCPSCMIPISIGTSKCTECWVQIPEMIRCPKCEYVIPLSSESCPECFAKLKDGIIIDDEPEMEEPYIQEEPLDELMPQEDTEEFIEEITEVYGVECPFCNAIANVSDDICPECGMPLIEEDETEKKLAPTYKTQKPEHDWYRIIAIGVVVILLVSGILPFAIPLPGVDRAQIRIDGAFGDWDQVTGLNDSVLSTMNPNVDIINYKMLSDSYNLYIYIQVQGEAFGDFEGNTARMFLDTDQNATTGYKIMGIGADYQIRVFGHDGVVESSSCLKFDNSRPQNDFNGFVSSCPSVPHTAQTVEDSDKFEVRVDLIDIDVSATDQITGVFYMADSFGESDYSDTPLTNLGSLLFIKQSSLVPASGILTGSSAMALSLEMKAIGPTFSIVSMAVPDCSGAYTATMNNGDVQFVNLTTSAATLGSGTLMVREAASANFDVPGVDIVIIGQGAYAYANAAPVLVTIDGAFADWVGKGLPLGDPQDDQLAKNGIDAIGDTSLDMLSQTTAVEDNKLNILVETSGEIFAGMWVPEIEETYVDTVTEETRSTDQPQSSDYTYTQPEVSRTRAPDIQRPTVKPVKSGEGAVKVFIDADGDTSTGYWFDGIGADYLLEAKGQDGKVTQTTLSSFSGLDRNVEEWTIQTVDALGASSGSRVEIAVPYSIFGTDVLNNATAKIQLVDWNMNGDKSDISAWDIFETGTRRGTRADSPPHMIIGKLTYDGSTLVHGETVVARDTDSNELATFITYTDPLATGSSYAFNFLGAEGSTIDLYGTNGTSYGTTSVVYPASNSIVVAPVMTMSSSSGYAPTNFNVKNLAPSGTDVINLTWTHPSNPSYFRVFRTDRTTSEGGYENCSRWYGNVPISLNLAGASVYYQDPSPVQNKINWYVIQSTDINMYYSEEIGIMADFTPPVITHTNMTYWAASQVPIQANITDAVGIQSATLFYKKAGAGAYTSKPMDLISGSNQSGDWKTWIPVDFSQPQVTYEYYLNVTDGTFYSLWGGPGNPITLDVEPSPDEPYPIYGYVYWNSTIPTPVANAAVYVEWMNKNGTIINEPGAFPYTTNAFGQYSIDMLDYDSNSLIWANATITIAGTVHWGYNQTQVVINPDNSNIGGERVDIYLEAPLLEINKTAPASANPGQNINYTITVTNIGNTTAFNVNVTETYPPEVTYITATPLPTFGNDTWTFPTIPHLIPGASFSIDITVTINPSALVGSTITNYANATWTNTTGENWGTVEAWANTTIGAAMLNITKWAPTYANPGETISYWLNYSNVGTEWAYNVVITETYLLGISFVSSIPAPTIPNNVWMIPLMAPYSSNSIQIFVTVNANATGDLMNQANITGPGLNTEWAFANTTVQNPEMTVDKTAPATANSGETITYQIDYQNIGTDWAYSIMITESYPVGVTFISSIPAPTVWPNVWLIGALAPGASGTIFIDVQINAGVSGTLTNLVDLDYENGIGTTMPTESDSAITVVADPLMYIEKTAPATANSGEIITYTIYYENVGNAWAYNINITESYPASITFGSAIPAPTFSNNVWIIPVLGPGAFGTILIDVTINPTATGTLTNFVSLAYQNEDGRNLVPVTDTAQTVIRDPNVNIDKTGPTSANTGEIIAYWLNYSNTGTGWAYNINITETYPVDVTYLSAIPAPTFSNNVWIIPSLGPGASGSILVTVQIDMGASSPQTNLVTLDYEDAAGEDQDQESDTVITVINDPLMIIAKDGPATANPDQDIIYAI
ncbi:MAG: hypothetical protein Q7J68_07205, partial [Thermoplasmata archaeon]|nr:hypothetical protein [Thermoplasmata archaeon]